MGALSEIVAMRNFNMAYIWMDVAFLLILSGLLIWQKKLLTFVWAIAGGILYLIVDYGIFYLATASRSIYIDGTCLGSGGTFLVLLWMSMSYGMTNFAWIWLALSRDEHLKEWTILIFGWWIACPMLAQMFTSSAAVQTVRTTNAYHGIMGLFLFVSYLAVIIYNMAQKDKKLRLRILRLCVIGIAIQFGWEFALLAGGIRSASVELTFGDKIRTLVVNSLVETNLGLPAIYLIFLAVTSKVTEDFKKRTLTIKERLLENNSSRK